ncbi:MAG: GNAT family N-acetyltransferase [bacterium]
MRQDGLSRLELTGYRPGAIGRITELHAAYYHEHWGLDLSFEIQVASELAGFLEEFRAGRDGLWLAGVEGAFAGSVAVDGRGAGKEGARLRWLIVPPVLQGLGIGKTLVRQAVDFSCQAGHGKIYLWTFRGLDAARALYEANGFRIAEEHDVDQWGRRLTEQKFELDLRKCRAPEK